MNYFTSNPVYDAGNQYQNSILWNAISSVPAISNTVLTFSYYSRYGYTLGNTTAQGSGWISQQQTIVLIPEPSSIAMFATGAVALAGLLRRRRR